MMIKLLRRVRRAEEKELALSRKQYEKFFQSFAEGLPVMLEEFGETVEALDDAIALNAGLECYNRADVLPALEEKMLLVACEAIQTAAMCRKMMESMDTEMEAT